MSRNDLPGPNDLDSQDLLTLFQDGPRKPTPGEECPSPETLWAAARGELGPKETRRAILHTGRCPSCAEDWRVARHLIRRLDRSPDAQDGDGEASDEAGDGSGRWWSSRYAKMAAAVVVALLGAGVLLWQQVPRERTLRDGPQSPGEDRSTIESRTPEDQPLSRDAPTLRWTGPDGAVYGLIVTAENLEVLVQEEGLTESEYTLSDALVASLGPGTMLNWRLNALLPDGSSVQSRTFRVELQ